MKTVDVAINTGLTCAHCQRPIRVGQVYVMLYKADKSGQMSWCHMHLQCDALRRGAVPVALRSLPMARRPDGQMCVKGGKSL